MKKLMCAFVVVAALLVAGCDVGKVNQVLPVTAVVDAVYSEKVSEWITTQVGKPKAESVVMTFWIDDGRERGNASFVIDGVEKVSPIANIDGFAYSDSRGFKFSYRDGEWKAFVAEDELVSREETPGLYFGDVVAALKKH